jgi:SulP family sulfate permease
MPHRHETAQATVPLRTLPAIALRSALRHGYSAADLRRDALAGAVVGVVALPLSMALSIAVGAPPQHGLYTAIVAGLVAAALGGSSNQVTGPTAAFIVVLAPIYARFGMGGLLLSGAMGGVLLIVMGLARMGRLIEFIPHPVTTGFTTGIATVIATLQLKDLLGLRLASNPDHFLERLGAMWSARATASLAELLVGLGTLAVLVLARRFTQRVPPALLALPLAALAVWILGRFLPGLEVATIASRFQSTVGGEVVAGIPRVPPMPMLPWSAPGPAGLPLELSFDTFKLLMSGAFAVAILGAIESLLSAVVADGMAGSKHDPDAELLAQGAANVVAPFFGGIPATGALARTATNVRSGGRTPIAAMVHAAVVLAAILMLSPVIGYLPMTSLAALLLTVAWNMSEVRHFGSILRVAPRSDVLVLCTCFFLTVVFDMVLAISVGVVLAALLFMRRMAEVTHTRLFEPERHEGQVSAPEGVVIYNIAGPLFFGAAQRAMGTLANIRSGAKVVVFRLDGVPIMDATGMVALESALKRLGEQGLLAILAGVQPQPAALLKKAGIKPREGVLLFADDLPAALKLASAR